MDMENLFIFGGTAVIAFSAIMFARLQQKQKRAYQNAVQKLKKDPNNPDLRANALQLGRLYSESIKGQTGAEQFNEVTMMNDINAACAGAVVKVEVTNAFAVSGKSVAQEIEKLGQLFLAGVVTAEEFERGKALFLGAPPDKVTSAVELLQSLYDLKKKGVLSESEFKMKKWEILSERQLPGRGQAAKL